MMTKTIYTDQGAPASALLAVTLRTFGTECLDWDPEVVRKEINSEFDMELSDLQSDKLQAAMSVLDSDNFETHWDAFVYCCQLFNNIPVSFAIFDEFEAEELIVGSCEALIIRNESIKYSGEVRAGAGFVFHEYGFSKAPKLFPNAIMPNTSNEQSDNKDEALEEIFDSHNKRVHEYFNKYLLT